MTEFPNFRIQEKGSISALFLEKGLLDFAAATAFVAKLPYRRNTNKNDLCAVFEEACGTCSTKHALLAELATENDFRGIDLILSIFQMNANNTPKIAETLNQNGLKFIPEAHNYLRYQNQLLDFTTPHPAYSLEKEILIELKIKPSQISSFKVDFHRQYLKRWLEENQQIPFSLNELWSIREKCIWDLANK
jgi:hypothetical protein